MYLYINIVNRVNLLYHKMMEYLLLNKTFKVIGKSEKFRYLF